MTEAEKLYAEFLDVLTDTISGTDMMSEAWHQEMYRFWLATRGPQWQPIATLPLYYDVLLSDGHNMIVGYKDGYGDYHAENVDTSYDMRVTINIGIKYWRELPKAPNALAI